MGTAPSELTNATARAHFTFDPRISLAGRRLMSINARTLRIPSAVPAAMTSRRVRGLRSLQRCLVGMSLPNLDPRREPVDQRLEAVVETGIGPFERAKLSIVVLPKGPRDFVLYRPWPGGQTLEA